MDKINSAYRRKVVRYGAVIVVLFVCALSYGTLGFYWIEKGSLFDSLYMAVITMTTVGFREVIPLTDEGRMFAMTAIFAGLFSSGVSIGLVTNLIFEETLINVLRGRKMEKQMTRMKGHYIVCGFGATGRSIVEELLSMGKEVVVVDKNEINDPILRRCLFLKGDARKDDTLNRVNVAGAAGLASTLTEDADNVFVALTARALNSDLRIVSRFKDEDSEKKLIAAGVDQVVSPYRIGGQRMSLALVNPAFQKILDNTLHSPSIGLQFAHIAVPERSPISGKTLREAGIHKHSHGALVVAAVEKNGRSLFNPASNLDMSNIVELVALGDDEQLRSLKTYLQGGNTQSDHV